MSGPIVLGQFTLQQVIGRGGMGEVWRAQHAGGVAVALKVLTADGARRALFRDALAAEILAVARLEHPALVAVHDHGLVDAAAERASGGVLRAGSPWMAMELVDGRSLDGLEGTLPWDEAARIVAEVLDGLAHAHAHGVVHRDVKPANVLLDRRRAVRLGDFGIARLDDRTQGARLATPAYAPPEQLSGDWRAQGPWTDVFATGRLLAALLAPESLVPEDLGAWLARATARDPRDRFPSARHAATALAALGPAAIPWTGPIVATGGRTLLIDDLVEEEPTAEPGPIVAPPVGDWLQPARRDDPLRQVAGLALWGLRPPRLVGRDAACEAMWRVFGESVADGPRLLLLRGPSNLGKTRLARTLGEAAHAAVGALVLTTRCDADEAATEGLARLVSAAVGATGLRPGEIAPHLEATVPGLAPRDRDALAGLLGAEAFHRSIDDLFPAVVALIRALAAPPEWTAARPVVIVLEDVQHGPDLLRWARQVLAAEKSLPLLLLGVLDDEPPTEPTRVVLDVVCQEPATRILEVGPLEPAAVRAILGDLVALDDGLAGRIADWTGGSPLFAVQILTDWVRRDALQPGDHGFRLRNEGDALPPHLDVLWSDRLSGWTRATSDTEHAALEAAAVLGDRIDTPSWDGLCAAVGNPDPRSALEGLLAAGLARTSPGEEAWWFADPSLRALVNRLASEGGRHLRLYRQVAGVLAARSDLWAGRQGRLLLAAGEPVQALNALVEALEARRRASRAQVETAATDLARALAQSGLPETSGLHARALVALAHHARINRGPDPLPGLLAAWPARGDWEPIDAARMAHGIARLYLARSATAAAREWLAEAVRWATGRDEPAAALLLHEATLDLADSLLFPSVPRSRSAIGGASCSPSGRPVTGSTPASLPAPAITPAPPAEKTTSRVSRPDITSRGPAKWSGPGAQPSATPPAQAASRAVQKPASLLAHQSASAKGSAVAQAAAGASRQAVAHRDSPSRYDGEAAWTATHPALLPARHANHARPTAVGPSLAAAAARHASATPAEQASRSAGEAKDGPESRSIDHMCTPRAVGRRARVPVRQHGLNGFVPPRPPRRRTCGGSTSRPSPTRVSLGLRRSRAFLDPRAPRRLWR